MPFADPERERAYRREYQRPAPLSPLPRHLALSDDIAQQRALADLEARHIGRRRAADRLKAWLCAENAWIAKTVGEPDARDR